MQTAAPHRRLPIVVLLSGRGSNLEAILNAIQHGELNVDVRAVISNRANAPGLDIARAAGIETRILNASDYPDRESFDTAMQQLIDQFEPVLVVLAGYMRILSDPFVQHYAGRLLNIHPSRLPAFRGLNTHQRAIDAGASEHGASVHFVTEELDGGPVVLQGTVPVRADDTAESLAERVLAQEHLIYPMVLQWYAEGRLEWRDGEVLLDSRVLKSPQQFAGPGSV